MPPNPFPIELTTRLSVMHVQIKDQVTNLSLSAAVNRNNELHRNVEVELIILQVEHHQQVEKMKKKLLDKKLELYVKEKISEDIALAQYGKYIIEVNARYHSYGQPKRYQVDFDEDGVSIAQE